MGVKRLCICISKGGYFWNDGGTRLDERWEGGVINPWVDAFTEQYQVHQGKARCLGGLHSARGVAFIRMMRSRGCRLIRMCFYLHEWALQCGRCIDICIRPVRLYAQFVSRPVRACAHLALALEGGCARARILR